uniref:hypothetical chloroplast RF66 n=1 Tax=Anemia phyllitidis TaxID=12940 RepID=UPI0021AC5FB5|nr:hypothetical chloroplast RF66 [Anemia phyllitidis]UUL71067.1 hypothetical chloroplast RF66 [Anemia phyllitidis]
MIHMELGPGAAVGIGSMATGIFLYALGKREPNVSRYYDSFISSIGLLCGGVLVFQGWRLDPILLLSETLLGGTTAFLIIENLQLRKQKIISFDRIDWRKLSNSQSIQKDLIIDDEDNFHIDLKINSKKIQFFDLKWKEIVYTTYVSKKNEVN